jgi:hypothetical protein
VGIFQVGKKPLNPFWLFRALGLLS